MVNVETFWHLHRSLGSIAQELPPGTAISHFPLKALQEVCQGKKDMRANWQLTKKHNPLLLFEEAEEYFILLHLFIRGVHLHERGYQRLKPFGELKTSVSKYSQWSKSHEKEWSKKLDLLLCKEHGVREQLLREADNDAAVAGVMARQIVSALRRKANGSGAKLNPLVGKLISGNLLLSIKNAHKITTSRLLHGNSLPIYTYDSMYFNWMTLMSCAETNVFTTCFPEENQGFSLLYEDELLSRFPDTPLFKRTASTRRYIVGNISAKMKTHFLKQGKRGIKLRRISMAGFKSVWKRYQTSFKSQDLVLADGLALYETVVCDHEKKVGLGTIYTVSEILSEAKAFFLELDKCSSEWPG